MVQIIHLLVVLIRHYRAPIRLPQNVTVSLVVVQVFVYITVKLVYLEHVDNWFLKLVLYYFNKYIFKNHLSTC